MPLFPRLSLIAACGALAALSGCGEPADTTARAPAAPAITAPAPSLWKIEVLDEAGAATSTTHICADDATREGFSRPAPEVGGQPCVAVGEAVEADGAYSVRCRIDDALYRVGAEAKGDMDQSFAVDMAVTRQDKKGPMFQQKRRYSRVGACPAGWRIGDSGEPGDAQVMDGVTGQLRAVEGASGG